MKKKLLFIIALYSMHFGLYSQKDYSVKDLVNYFKKIEVPFTTEHINTVYSELPYDLSLKYFFRNDTAFSYYYYEIENMEDHTIMESGYRKKNILPRNFFCLNSKLFSIYELIDEQEDPYTFLSIWNNEEQTDSLIISHETSYSTIKSKIYENGVIVFNYHSIEGREWEETGISTSIQVSHYSIDTENGKFIKTKTEKFQSEKYDLYQFDEGKLEEVKQEDPYYKYWMLWNKKYASYIEVPEADQMNDEMVIMRVFKYPADVDIFLFNFEKNNWEYVESVTVSGDHELELYVLQKFEPRYLKNCE